MTDNRFTTIIANLIKKSRLGEVRWTSNPSATGYIMGVDGVAVEVSKLTNSGQLFYVFAVRDANGQTIDSVQESAGPLQQFMKGPIIGVQELYEVVSGFQRDNVLDRLLRATSVK